MRKLILLNLIVLFTTSAWGQSTQVVNVNLQQVVKKVSSENYSVYQSSLRVYQAKEAITVARMNLLPKLNLWNLAQGAISIFAGGPAGAVGGAFSIVEDVAPFLVPANWFRLSQSKVFYKADLEGYRALWANEVMTAKAIYYHLLLDSSLKEHIQRSQKDLEDIYQIVKVRETFGGLPPRVSQEIKIRLLSLEEDLRALDVLIAEEESLLAFMMGYPTGTKVNAQKIALPDFENLNPLDYSDFEFRAVDISPEVKQFDLFIKASDSAKKEITYSFLGASSMSRGTSGGVFDNLPSQAGLGFGMGASIRIVKSQKEILKVQKKALEETVKRNLKLLVNNYNLDVVNYSNLSQRVSLAEERMKQIYQRIQFGEDVDALELVEASRNLVDADTSLFSVMYRFVNNEDKLSRLIFHGDYSKAKLAVTKFEKESK